MQTQFSRTELLLGEESMARLSRARVAIFGVGGVGGYVCEALVRSGVGAFDLIDNDKVCHTSDNWQIQNGRDERADDFYQSAGGYPTSSVLFSAGKCK